MTFNSRALSSFVDAASANADGRTTAAGAASAQATTGYAADPFGREIASGGIAATATTCAHESQKRRKQGVVHYTIHDVYPLAGIVSQAKMTDGSIVEQNTDRPPESIKLLSEIFKPFKTSEVLLEKLHAACRIKAARSSVDLPRAPSGKKSRSCERGGRG